SESALGSDPATERRPALFATVAATPDRLEILIRDSLALMKFNPVLNIGDDRRRFSQGKYVGAQAENACGDVLISTVDKADDGDDRSDSDDHADQRKGAAQLMRP